MRRAAVAGAGMVLALGAVPGVAFAHPGAPAAKKLVVKVSPTKHVKSGTTIKVSAKHALKNKQFYCALTVINKKHHMQTYPDPTTFQEPTASKKGTFKCAEKFVKFSGAANDPKSTKVSCPVSKKLAKKHWSCAVVVADAATSGKSQLSITYFTAKK